MAKPPQKPETRVVRAGLNKARNAGIVNTPVFHASTVVFDSVAAMNAAGDKVFKKREKALYYGRRGTLSDGTVFDVCEYHPDQVERLARRAFGLAAGRGGRLLSVDKANVLDTSRMWRRVLSGLAGDYPEVELRHGLVDSVAMQLVLAPGSFDVIVTENTFGDILSDVAAGVTGGLGLASSASLSDDGPGIFEPVHGSAPDIAGSGVANPAGMLRSLALALDHGLGEPALARALELAVGQALEEAPTPDLGGEATTEEFGAFVVGELGRRRAA